MSASFASPIASPFRFDQNTFSAVREDSSVALTVKVSNKVSDTPPVKEAKGKLLTAIDGNVTKDSKYKLVSHFDLCMDGLLEGNESFQHVARVLVEKFSAAYIITNDEDSAKRMSDEDYTKAVAKYSDALLDQVHMLFQSDRTGKLWRAFVKDCNRLIEATEQVPTDVGKRERDSDNASAATSALDNMSSKTSLPDHKDPSVASSDSISYTQFNKVLGIDASQASDSTAPAIDTSSNVPADDKADIEGTSEILLRTEANDSKEEGKRNEGIYTLKEAALV